MVTDQDQATIERGEAVLDAINQHIFLVKLSVSRPRLSYTIADAVVEVSDQDGNKQEVDAEYRDNPKWRLIPTEWKNRLSSLESAARKCLTDASISFGTGGMATIPIRRAEEVFAKLREHRDTMAAYRDEFSDLYTTLLADTQSDISNKMSRELASKAIAKLPTQEQIRGAFAITWAIVPIGNSGINQQQLQQLQQIKDNLYDAMDAEHDPVKRSSLNSIVTQVTDIIRDTAGSPKRLTDDEANEFVTEARRQMADFANEFVQNVSREPRKRLADALGHLLEMIRQNKNIQGGSLNNVRNAIQMIRDFSFVQDNELMQMLDNVETEMQHTTPQQINSDSVFAAQFAEAVTPAVEACRDASQAASNERRFSRLVLKKRKEPTAVS